MKSAKRKDWRIDGISVAVGEVRGLVFRRDRTCLAFQHDRTHVCTDRWGERHAPDVAYKLTLEHVPGVHGPADVRRDDPEHCVAMCCGTNVRGPSTMLREFCRDHLRKLYPGCRG